MAEHVAAQVEAAAAVGPAAKKQKTKPKVQNVSDARPRAVRHHGHAIGQVDGLVHTFPNIKKAGAARRFIRARRRFGRLVASSGGTSEGLRWKSLLSFQI